jgi:hypothetical protein
MFELILPDKLVNGTKYMIDKNYYQYRGVFKNSHIYDDILCLKFDKLYNIKAGIVSYSNTVEVCPSFQFYTFVSQNPQGQMERRAVNLIVRRLLGDDCFKW